MSNWWTGPSGIGGLADVVIGGSRGSCRKGLMDRNIRHGAKGLHGLVGTGSQSYNILVENRVVRIQWLADNKTKNK